MYLLFISITYGIEISIQNFGWGFSFRDLKFKIWFVGSVDMVRRTIRWIVLFFTSSLSKMGLADRFHQERFIIFTQNTFFFWFDDSQNCLGAKFAQMKFVVVLACILQNHRLSTVQNFNESFEKVKQRMLILTQNYDLDLFLFLFLRNADEIRSICKRVRTVHTHLQHEKISNHRKI